MARKLFAASGYPKAEFRLDRADWLSLAVILALAIIARLIFILTLPPLLHLDSDSYFEIAQRLWRGEGFGDLSRRTPVYPLFLSLAARSATAGLFPVVVAQHLLGIATVVLFYLLARRLFPARMRPAGVVSGLILAVMPYPILIEHSILSESLFTFLLTASAYSLLAWWQEDRSHYAWGCGALLALAALTRPIAAGVFPLWAGLLFLLEWKSDRKRATRFLLRAGLAWAVLLLPLLIRNYAVMGSFALERSLGRNLISVADRWISYGVVNEPGAYPEVKSVYGAYRQQKRGPDAVVVYSAMPELRRTTGWSDAEIDRALAAIAWEAIRSHPWEFTKTRLRRLPLLFRDPGPSQWSAFEAETYLPFLQFLGRINPDLASRSVALPGLPQTRFELAERSYEVLARNDILMSFRLTSGGWVLFPVLGFAGLLLVERRKETWVWGAMLAYLWLGTIFTQPPNARYRIPTLPWEALFAVAGFWLVIRGGVWVIRKVLAAVRHGEESAMLCPFSRKDFSDARVVWLATAAILLILGGRAWAIRDARPILQAADLVLQRSGDPAETSPSLIRELPAAGRTLTVFYWEDAEPPRDATVSAEAPVPGGGSYAVRAFYSCETAACAGAEMELSALDEHGRALAQAAAPLAQERVDNDLFWDQIELPIAAPSDARRLRLELRLKGGMGNLVIPWIELRPAGKLAFRWLAP
jgi:hypothetical protein